MGIFLRRRYILRKKIRFVRAFIFIHGKMLQDQIRHLQMRIAMGDQSALRKLHVMLSGPLFQLSNAMVRSRQIAEEVVEDVFIKTWEQRNRLGELDNLRAYLFVLARNLSVDHLRKISGKRVCTLEDVNVPVLTVQSNPEDMMISREIVKRINLAINDLPPKCKLIFKLVKMDGLRHKEVAEVLNISLKTVESQMSIALKKLHYSIQMYIPVHSKK